MNRKCLVLSVAMALTSLSIEVNGDVLAESQVSGSGGSLNGAGEIGSKRTNQQSGSHNGASGLTHVQQNNGNTNGVGAATTVHAGTLGSGDINTSASVSGGTVISGTGTDGATRKNHISNSFNNYKGITTVQQNNGDGNVIGSATTVYVDTSGNTLNAGASADSSATDNGNTSFDTSTNRISGSFSGFRGIASVQQNNGNTNVLGVATTVGADASGNAAIYTNASAESGTFSNRSQDSGSTHRNRISESFHRFKGLATMQQNNGDSNAISAVTAVHTDISGGTAVATDASAASAAISNVSRDSGSTRKDRISNSFNSLSGLSTTQQNNGNNNALNAATTLHTGTPDSADVTASAGAVGGPAVLLNNSQDSGSTRENDISSSFSNSKGLATVQENNGDNNAVSVAITVHVGTSSDTGASTSATIGSGASLNDSINSNSVRNNKIADSFNTYKGIVAVQQNSGDNNAIGAAIAVYRGASEGAITRTSGNSATDTNSSQDSNSTRNSRISGSFNGFNGLANQQQNNGSNNGISTAIAVRVDTSGNSLDPSVSSNTFAFQNSSQDSYTTRENRISGSFNGFKGIASIQQNNGDNNAIFGTTAVHVGTLDGGDINVGASGQATTFMNLSEDVGSTRKNHISESFNHSKGLGTVQQNNGNNNAIGAANAVQVNKGADLSAFGNVLSTTALSSNATRNGTNISNETNYHNSISNSYRGAAGIHVVQQNNGSSNAIQSAISVVATRP